MAENVAFKLNLDAGGAPKTLADLEKRVQDVNEELSKTEIGTQQYEALRKELVRNNKELKNLELGYEALDVEQQAAELGSVAGAVGDVTSAFVLLGGESDTLQQIAESIQTALGVSMAFKGAIEGVASARKLLNSLDKESGIIKAKNFIVDKGRLVVEKAMLVATKAATIAQKAFNVVLKANPIGLIVTAVGLLITGIVALVKNFDSVKAAVLDFIESALKPFISLYQWLTGSTNEQIDAEKKAGDQRRDEQKKLKDEHAERMRQIKAEADAQRKATQSKLNEVNKEIELAELRGEDTFRLHKERLKLQLQETKTNLEELQKRLKHLEEYFREEARMQGLSDEQYFELMMERGFDLEKFRQRELRLIEEQQHEVEKAEAEITGLVREERKKRSAAADKVRQEQAKKDQEAFNARQKQIQEETKALMTFYDKVEKIENEYNNRFITKQDQQENAVRDKYFALIAEAEKYGEDIAILEMAREAELLDIRQEFKDKQDKLDEQAKEKKEQDRLEEISKEEEARDKRIAIAQQSLNSLNALNDLAFSAEIERIKAKEQAGEKLSANERKRLKRDEQIRKAFAVAQVAIDTASAISSAIAGATAAAAATGPGAVVATPLFIVSQIATVLGAFAQVASILRAPSPSIGNISGGGEIDAPDTEGAAQDAPDNNQFDSGSTFLDIPQKVYVLEQDITNTQDTVANIKQQATFG
jgi:DNA repair exonuclease SbcCD ATPase subunit